MNYNSMFVLSYLKLNIREFLFKTKSLIHKDNVHIFVTHKKTKRKNYDSKPSSLHTVLIIFFTLPC